MEWTGMDWVFAVAAAIGAVFLITRIALMAIGIGHDVDALHAPADLAQDSDSAFKALSLQGLTAFFLMFGLVGLALSRDSLAPTAVCLAGALAAGAGSMWFMGRIFAWAASLQSSGTLKIENALGANGRVYLTIPAKGEGKVEVTVQGRLMVFDAVSTEGVELRTDTQVTVQKVIKPATLGVVQA